MPDHRLEIILAAKDVTQKVFRSFSNRMNAIKSQVFSLHGALITLAGGYGVGKLTGGFLDAARTSENFQTRLEVLLGSVEEGSLLFKEMADYAGSVPFEYEKVMASATQLAGVMKGGVDEIKQWMPMIGDLAAASGLGIEKTTEQVIRMYSAGAASADLFRERGILAMLGFEAGVSYSAEETRKKMFDEWLKADSQFHGATDKMADDWDGIMSMMSDKWFQFRNMVMEKGLFDALKTGFGTINKELDELKRTGKLDIWAQQIAIGVLSAVKQMMEGFQTLNNAVMSFKWSIAWFEEQRHKIRAWSLGAWANITQSGEEGQVAWGKIGEETEYLKKETYDLIQAEKEAAGIWSDIQRANAEAFDAIDRQIRAAIDLLEKMKKAAAETKKETSGIAGGGAGGKGATFSGAGNYLYYGLGEELAAWKEYYDAIAAYEARRKEEYKAYMENRRQILQQNLEFEKEMAEERKRIQENQFATDHRIMEAMRIGWGLTWDEIRAGGVDAWADINQAMMTVTQQSSSALADWVLGMKSAKEAAKDLAEDILRQAIKTMVQIGMQRLILSQIQKSSTMEEAGVTVAAMAAINKASTPAAIQTTIATSGASAYMGMAAYTTSVTAMMALAESLGYIKAAKGGIFTRPTFALFGEEGPEMVLPLSPSRRPEAYSVMTQAMKYMDGGSRPAGGGFGGGIQPAQNVHITIQALDARSFVELAQDNPEAIVGPFRSELRGGDRGLLGDIRRVTR